MCTRKDVTSALTRISSRIRAMRNEPRRPRRHLTLDIAAQRDAFTPGMRHALSGECEAIGQDEEVAVVVLREHRK